MPQTSPPDEDDTEAEVAVETGRRGQRLVVSGWFASHADSGTPGPHVAMTVSDGQQAALRTDQIPELVDALTTVAERIERLWAAEGEEYADAVVRRHPDPQDPAVIDRGRRDRLRFVESVRAHLPEVVRLLAEAASTDEAVRSVGTLLDADAAEVLVGLARFDLLALTQPATERRLRTLADPEG